MSRQKRALVGKARQRAKVAVWVRWRGRQVAKGALLQAGAEENLGRHLVGVEPKAPLEGAQGLLRKEEC